MWFVMPVLCLLASRLQVPFNGLLMCFQSAFCFFKKLCGLLFVLLLLLFVCYCCSGAVLVLCGVLMVLMVLLALSLSLFRTQMDERAMCMSTPRDDAMQPSHRDKLYTCRVPPLLAIEGLRGFFHDLLHQPCDVERSRRAEHLHDFPVICGIRKPRSATQRYAQAVSLPRFPMICGIGIFHIRLCDAMHELNHHHIFAMICGTGIPQSALRCAEPALCRRNFATSTSSS